jgi:nicotinamide-nucleotide amidase
MNPPRAAILSVGDELVLGTALDTNSRTLSAALRDAGLEVVEHRTVRDELGAIESAMRELAARSDVLVSTGGLGPTDDDLTRPALNAIVDGGAPMVEDPVARADLESWFAGRGRPMASINLRQAMRPRSARIVRNPGGTAPGLHASIGACRAWFLPGPPREMVPMFESEVLPAVRPVGAPMLAKRTVQCFGIGESALAELLGERMARGRDPEVGTTASGSVVSIQVVARGPGAGGRAEAEAAACAAVAWPWAFAGEGGSLAGAVLEECRAAGVMLAVAESCTGGIVGGMLTAVSGSSNAFAGGWISYSNDFKERELGVPRAVLDSHGAVSREAVEAMARGASARAHAGIAVAISGIAGPGGGSEEKPVGTVWIGVHDARGGCTVSRRFEFPGGREIVRDRAAKAALQLVRWTLRGEHAAMIWERA